MSDNLGMDASETNTNNTANTKETTMTFSYSAFGRSFPTTAEAEAYGRNLMADSSAWEGTTPPTSFTLFQQADGCMPVALWRVSA